jgi:ABC-type sugar transport system ATPase subunit
MPQPLLQAEDLYKSYGRHKVLRGVSFEIAPGTLADDAGENGAGIHSTADSC